jgi:hypothetical protein
LLERLAARESQIDRLRSDVSDAETRTQEATAAFGQKPRSARRPSRRPRACQRWKRSFVTRRGSPKLKT